MPNFEHRTSNLEQKKVLSENSGPFFLDSSMKLCHEVNLVLWFEEKSDF